MATDVHGQTVPAAGDAPARSAFLNLGLSLRPWKVVANMTARAQYITDLAAASITPSTSNPIFVFRTDAVAGQELEYTTDGSAWYRIDARQTGLTTSGIVSAASGWSIDNQYGYIRSGIAFVTIVVTRTGAAISVPANGDVTNTSVATLQSGWTPAAAISPPVTSGHIARGAFGRVNDSSVIELTAVAGSGDVNTSAQITLGGSWPVA